MLCWMLLFILFHNTQLQSSMVTRRIVVVHTGAGGEIDTRRRKKYRSLLKEVFDGNTSMADDRLEDHLSRFVDISGKLEASTLTNTGYGSCICSDGSVRCDSSIVHLSSQDQNTEIGCCVCNSSRYPMADAVDVILQQRTESHIQGVVHPVVRLGKLERDDMLVSPEMSLIRDHYVNGEKNSGNQDGVQDTIGVMLFEVEESVDGNSEIKITVGSSSGGNMLRDWRRVGSAGVPGSGCWLEKNHHTGDIVCAMVSGQGEAIIRSDLARKVVQAVNRDISSDPSGFIPVESADGVVSALSSNVEVGVLGFVVGEGLCEAFTVSTSNTFVVGSASTDNRSSASCQSIKTSNANKAGEKKQRKREKASWSL